MKRLMTMAAVLLLSALLAMPALAAPQEKNVPKPLPEQAQASEAAQDAHETEAFKRQQATVEKREAMRARRDEALKVRERNVTSNNPGKTGL